MSKSLNYIAREKDNFESASLQLKQQEKGLKCCDTFHCSKDKDSEVVYVQNILNQQQYTLRLQCSTIPVFCDFVGNLTHTPFIPVCKGSIIGSGD